MKTNLAHYIAESGPVLAACEKFRKEYSEWHSTTATFLHQYGARSFRLDIDGYVHSLDFDGKPPAGFRKPGRDGACQPLKKSEWPARFKELGQCPQPDNYLTDLIKCPSWISYYEKGNPKHNGGFHIGGFLSTYQICWYAKDGPLLVVMPDLPLELKRFKEERPDCVIDNGADNWTLPAGLKPILPEEWDFWAAKHEKEAA